MKKLILVILSLALLLCACSTQPVPAPSVTPSTAPEDKTYLVLGDPEGWAAITPQLPDTLYDVFTTLPDDVVRDVVSKDFPQQDGLLYYLLPIGATATTTGITVKYVPVTSYLPNKILDYDPEKLLRDQSEEFRQQLFDRAAEDEIFGAPEWYTAPDIESPNFGVTDGALWIFQPVGESGYARYITQHGHELMVLDIHTQPTTEEAALAAAKTTVDTMEMNPRKGLWDEKLLP